MGTERIFDATQALKVAGDVALELGRDRHVRIAVEGPPGSGRATLVDSLAEKLGPSAVVVRVPPSDDADVPLHALLQAAQARTGCASSAVRGDASFAERVRDVYEALATAGLTLVVHFPDDIRRPRRDDEQATKGWVDTFVTAAVESDGLAFALVAPEGALQSLRKVPSFKRHALRAPSARPAALHDASHWGTFASSAEELASAVSSPARSFGPLQIRLMVGLVALGVPASEVVRVVRGTKTTDVDQLVGVYARLLNTREHDALRRAARRLLLARSSLPFETALRIVEAPSGMAPLFTRCLAYGETSLRVAPSVRTPLLRSLLADAKDEERAHEQIARHHASLDGALSPIDAAKRSGETLVHWLEKVHHLAHSGTLGKTEWERQALGSREFLIDRARSLSMEAGDYLGAADLYAKCITLRADDAYAFHYRGFNLDKLGRDAVEVERCYREALKLESSNLFYNSRLVTFLVERARYADAEAAFQDALENLDCREPREVFWHTTTHVVRAWLDAGEVRRARDAFDTVSPALANELGEQLTSLRQRLEDAEEAERLGTSVYPADVPMAKRWGGPRLAQSEHNGRRLLDWYPGRVALAEDESGDVVVTWVVPTEKRVLASTYTPDEWRGLSGHVPSEEPLFVELAAYDGLERWVVFTDPHTPLADPRTADERHPLRYLLGRKVEGSILG